MRFAKAHPTFLALFALSLTSLVVAFILAANSSGACTGSDGNASTDPTCTFRAQSQNTMSIVLALGALTAMIGGAGFQIGRARADALAAMPYSSPGGAPYPTPPYPPGYAPGPAYPAQPTYPAQPQPAYPAQPTDPVQPPA